MAAPSREELKEERAIFDLKQAPTANCYDSLFEMDECVVELLEGELTTDQLQEFHQRNGGVVLSDEEFGRYRAVLEVLAAEEKFAEYFAEGASRGYSSKEFQEMYAMREEIKGELTKFGRGKTVKEMSDREVQEFFEYLHQTYEVGLEEKIHALS